MLFLLDILIHEAESSIKQEIWMDRMGSTGLSLTATTIKISNPILEGGFKLLS